MLNNINVFVEHGISNNVIIKYFDISKPYLNTLLLVMLIS